MPYFATKRFPFHGVSVERGEPVPHVEGAPYRKLLALGYIEWRDEIAIPRGWRKIHWTKQRTLALALRPDAEVSNRADAVAIIEAALDAR